jgi:hypothetical protein
MEICFGLTENISFNSLLASEDLLKVKFTHTVTHKHPHNIDHHHFPTPPIPHPPIPPNPDWFEQHHIFNPNFCTPGLLY